MDNHQTVEKLRNMRLGAMARLHSQYVQENRCGKLSPDEYLALLIEHEWEDRQNRKMARLIKQASFREDASLADVDYLKDRNLDRNMFERLATMDFMARRENMIIVGASGVGKSYLAQALGHQACLNGKRVLYSGTARLLARLRLAKVDGTYLKQLKRVTSMDLLILDDFGLQAFDNLTREILLDIIDDRFRSGSTIVASQIPVSSWHQLIGEGTIADAILDRIVNSSHRIELKGESLRKGLLLERK